MNNKLIKFISIVLVFIGGFMFGMGMPHDFSDEPYKEKYNEAISGWEECISNSKITIECAETLLKQRDWYILKKDSLQKGIWEIENEN